jgi:tetratricopeptide (TPR) repeat protein
LTNIAHDFNLFNMNKYKIIPAFLLSLFFFSFSYAQKKKEDKSQTTPAPTETSSPKSKEYLLSESVFRNSLKYGDLNVAKQCVYEMIALDPSNTMLYDTLLIIYFRTENFAQSILLSREILAKNPNNATLEIKAISEQNLRLYKESLESYEKLYASTKDIYHLYQLSAMQFQLKRYGECNMSLAQVIRSEEADKKTIPMSNAAGAQIDIALKAAAYNILGVMAIETNSLEDAKKYLIESLKLQPDFDLAKNNLSIANEKSKPAPDSKSNNATPKK